MEDFVYYGELYDLYEGLLTDKQKKYFQDYYFQNLSLGEMAINYNISRNAIFKQIHITVKKLEEYEAILHLYEKKVKLGHALQMDSLGEIKKMIEEVLWDGVYCLFLYVFRLVNETENSYNDFIIGKLE